MLYLHIFTAGIASMSSPNGQISYRMNPNINANCCPTQLGQSLNNMSVVGNFAVHTARMREEQEKTKPVNTNFAYDNKEIEFIEFCKEAFPDNPSMGEISSIVSPAKLYQFLFYISRREKRSTRFKVEGSLEKFNKEEYMKILNDPSYCAKFPLGHSTMKQYHAAVMRLYQKQLDSGTNNFSKEQLMSNNTKFLMQQVKERKARIEEENCVEKNKHSTNAFELSKQVPRIEEWMFNRSNNHMTNGMSALRNRYFCLKTHNAILRGESLFKSDLSDMCGVTHVEEGSADVEIQIMRIATGKTNNLKTLYGRCMRHNNVNLCPLGAAGFYLMMRFHVLDEKINFSNNEDWFHIKMLVDPKTKNTQEPMDDKHYVKFVKEACDSLEIHSSKFIHFGRSVGAATADLRELEGYDQVSSQSSIKLQSLLLTCYLYYDFRMI